HTEGLEATIGEDAGYEIERPGPARPKTIEAIARRLGEATCPGLMFGEDVWRTGAGAGGGKARARGAGGRGVGGPADLSQLPPAASALLRQLPGAEGLHQDHRARAGPDLPGRLPGRARTRQ